MSNLYDLGASLETEVRCVKSEDIVFQQNGKSILKFSRSNNDLSGALFKYFFVTFSVPIYPRITAGIALEQSQYKVDTSSTINFYLEYYNNLGIVELVNPVGLGALNDLGMKVYQMQEFTKLCGTQYKVSYTLGSKLEISLKILYSTNYDKKELELALLGTIDIWVVIGKIKLALNKQVQEKNISFALEIAAYQEGGDAFLLSKIFGKDGNAKNLLKCGINDFKACEDMISDLIRYAREDYPKQLSTLDSAVILDTGYQSYNLTTEIGSNDSTYDYKRIIAEIYTNLNSQKNFIINHLLSNSYYDEEDRDAYKHLEIDLSSYPSKIAKIGANRNVSTFWKWDVEMLLTPARLNLDALVKKIDKAIEETEEVAKSCSKYTASVCEKLIDKVKLQLPNIEEVNGYKQSLLMIANCDNQVYAKYLFPIGEIKDQIYIYQENTRYQKSDGSFQYLSTRYTLQDDNLYVIESELFSEMHFCNHIEFVKDDLLNNGFATVINQECIELICPSFSRTVDIMITKVETEI